jgi:hypothetical protein
MIEELIQTLIDETKANTAAQKENTAALLQVLAASGNTVTTTPVETPALKKELKTTKIGKNASKVELVEAAPEPEPTPTPEPEPEPEAPADDTPFNRDEVLLEISTSVKAWMKQSGNKVIAHRNLYEENRKAFGVATAAELDDSKLPEFAAMVKKMIADNPVG